MKFDLSHRTTYDYSEPVAYSQHLVHLIPRLSTHQNNLRQSLIVEPAPTSRLDGRDAFGNPTAMLEIDRPHECLIIQSRAVVETHPPVAAEPARTTAWDRLQDVLYARDAMIDLDVVQYRCVSGATKASAAIADYARISFAPGRPVLDACHDLILRVYRDFTFDPRATDLSTPITDVFQRRRGVCQDFAHLTLACFRAMKVPARYVSGYILTHPPPGQPKLIGADASHAWVDVWSPEYGWSGLDPTNGIAAAEEHIVVAYGRDYSDISPINGVLLGGGTHTVSVSVDISPAG